MGHGAPKRDRIEPFFWLLFGAGGMVNAFLAPALILLLGIGLAIGLVSPSDLSHARVSGWFSHVLVRLAVAGILVAVLFHGAHRLRFTLVDLGLKSVAPAISFVCYGGAIVGSLYCFWRMVVWG